MHKLITIIVALSALLLSLSLSANLLPIDGAQQFAQLSRCELENGAVINNCKIGYRTFGQLNAAGDNAVLVPTWFNGDSAEHIYMAAKGFLDPEHYFVVIVDALGNGVSSSPSNSDSQADGDFPLFSIRDMVDSQHRLLTQELSVTNLHAVIGVSMGGMQAFEWAVRYPNFVNKTVAAIGSPRLPAFDTALWETRNRLLALYRQCQCEEALQAIAGMGMLARVPEELSASTPSTEVVSSMQSTASKYYENPRQSWDSQRQAQAMLRHNIARDFNDNMELAAKKINSQFLIIVGADDRIVSPSEALAFAKLVNAKTLIMDNDCGHSEPWCDPTTFAKNINEFLKE